MVRAWNLGMNRCIDLLVEDEQRSRDPQDNEQRAQTKPEPQVSRADETADALHGQKWVARDTSKLRGAPR